MESKVLECVNASKKAIEEGLKSGAITQEKLDWADLSYNIGVNELCTFQLVQSLAYTSGIVTLEDSTAIYRYLGGSPSHFNKQPIWVKITVLEALRLLALELIKIRDKTGTKSGVTVKAKSRSKRSLP